MPRTFLPVAAAVAALALTACSSSPQGNATSAAPTSAPATSAAASSSSAPSSASSTAASSAAAKPLYVALGDSLAAGFQPDQGDLRDTAYPALYAADAPVALELNNLGCSGERSGTILRGSRCPYPSGGQLDEAEAAMKGREVALVSVDIGGNDVLQCARAGGLDPTCAQTGLESAAKNLPVVMKRLRAAAGPDAVIAAFTYYDPFLAWQLDGKTVEAQTAQAVLTQLNATITKAAKGVGAVVVDIPKAFSMADTTKATVEGKTSTKAVAEVCRLTWYCDAQDIHLTEAGNDTYAAALAKVVDPLLSRR